MKMKDHPLIGKQWALTKEKLDAFHNEVEENGWDNSKDYLKEALKSIKEMEKALKDVKKSLPKKK